MSEKVVRCLKWNSDSVLFALKSRHSPTGPSLFIGGHYYVSSHFHLLITIVFNKNVCHSPPFSFLPWSSLVLGLYPPLRSTFAYGTVAWKIILLSMPETNYRIHKRRWQRRLSLLSAFAPSGPKTQFLQRQQAGTLVSVYWLGSDNRQSWIRAPLRMDKCFGVGTITYL